MKYTNIQFIKFCQEMLGTPYWYGVPTIKATKTAYKTNALKFPLEYKPEDEAYYLNTIENNEIVTDTLGLIKGFMWSNGGELVINSRHSEESFYLRPKDSSCPDKGINGLFSYSIELGSPWGEIADLPEVPGIIVTYNGYLAIYEGKGNIIEVNPEEKKCKRSKLNRNIFKYWYELPFINYIKEETPIKKENQEVEEEQKPLCGFTLANTLLRDEAQEDAKFLDIIKKDTIVNIVTNGNKWHQISLEDKEGYALSKYFLLLNKKPQSMKFEKLNQYILHKKYYTVGLNISLRETPTTRGKILINIPKGEKLYSIGFAENGWPLLVYENKEKLYMGYANINRLIEKEDDQIEEDGIL